MKTLLTKMHSGLDLGSYTGKVARLDSNASSLGDFVYSGVSTKRMNAGILKWNWRATNRLSLRCFLYIFSHYVKNLKLTCEFVC